VPHHDPQPQTIYPPTGDCGSQAYERFAQVVGDHTKSVFFPDTNTKNIGDGLAITRTALRFCPGFDLFEVKINNRSGFLVASLDTVNVSPIYLNATSTPIHEGLIKSRNLKINKTTVVQYLRFFCRFVHGDQGAFPIIERACQLKWRFQTDTVRAEVDQQLIQVRLLRELNIRELLHGDIEENIQMMARKRSAAEAVQSLVACVSFGRMLSLAWFMVFENGEVAMAADWELVSHLPVYPQMFTGKDNFAFVEDVLR